ncbi:glycosyltransferase, partial [Pseudonocardia abyssalis]
MLTDVLVPGNRYDLLDEHPVPRPEVSVVVAHYRQPEQLARTWHALCHQTLRPVEIVIADDGSDPPPEVPTGGPPVRVVTQADLGFRAAAARNLGVAATSGEVLVFLDADTVPEPDFLERLTARVARCSDVLAVGRRRHADLTGLPPGTDPRTLPELPEPAWLRKGYAETRDLLDADGTSFRFVISAVLACRRSLFDDIGGFDERFVGYGGEDWDLAYRAWNNGAVLVHERSAVAWHDGPDWALRGGAGKDAEKDRERTRLAELIPEPGTRRGGPPGGLPDVLVTTEPGPGAALVASSLRDQEHHDMEIGDRWSPDQLLRARVRMRVAGPLPRWAVGAAVRALVDGDLATVVLRRGDTEVATACSTRALGRARRQPTRADVDGFAFGHADLEL